VCDGVIPLSLRLTAIGTYAYFKDMVDSSCIVIGQC